jgi:virginiamycin B lyase
MAGVEMQKSATVALIIAWLYALTPAMAGENLPIDRLEVQAKIPSGGDFMAYGFNSLWMMSGTNMLRVNPVANSIAKIDVAGAGGRYRGIAVGDGAVWIPDTISGTIYKLDPQSNTIILKIPVKFFDSEGSIGAGEGAVWVVVVGQQGRTMLTRFNSETGAAEANIPLDQGSISAVVGFGSIWVTNNEKNLLYRIDPKTNSVVSTTTLREHPRFLTTGEGSIWVLNQGDGSVQRIGTVTGKVVATIDTLPGYCSGGDIATGGGYVWVTLKGYPVVQIDPRTNAMKRAYKGFGMGDAIRYGADSLWVSGSNIFRIKPPD